MASQPQGCARLTGSVVGLPPLDIQAQSAPPIKQEEKKMTARVGQKAPEFIAPAYYRGGFTTVNLADYLGKWVLVCFYPGDFTFV